MDAEINIALIVTISLILLSIVVGAFLLLSRRPKENRLLLVGLSGSGKTALFYQLVAKSKIPTVTSQVKNEFILNEGKKTYTLIDMPGHPRIRTEVMSAIKTATAIIFAIDSETVLRNMNNIANFLYDILSSFEIIKNKVPILILATKADILGARDIDTIQQELESEIDYIRSIRLKSNYVQEGETEQIFIGEEGKEFAFKQISNPIHYGTCSVNNNDVQQVDEFIHAVLK